MSVLVMLSGAQNDNNVVFVLTLQCFNELRRFPHLTFESQSHLAFPRARFAAARSGTCVAAERALSRLAVRRARCAGSYRCCVVSLAWCQRVRWRRGMVPSAVSADDRIAKNNATRRARRL